MKKSLVVLVMFFLLVFLAACIDDKIPIATATVNPSAQPLLETIAVYAQTVEGIAKTATAYAFTPTLTLTPTVTPNAPEVNKMISNSINGQLIATFGAKISVSEVKFGPIGAQKFTNLYIEISCEGINNAACPTSYVIIAVIDACKEKKKKVLENIPSTTELLTITIFDPVNLPKVVEINWQAVLAYLDGDVSGDYLNQQIKYIQ